MGKFHAFPHALRLAGGAVAALEIVLASAACPIAFQPEQPMAAVPPWDVVVGGLAVLDFRDYLGGQALHLVVFIENRMQENVGDSGSLDAPDLACQPVW